MAAISSLALSFTAASLGNTSQLWWYVPAGNLVFPPSLPLTSHPMPELLAGLGHKRLTGRTQEAGDSIYSLWSWGREKKKGKGWALFFFLPSPTHSKGFWILSPGRGQGAHGTLCWRVQKDAAKQQGGRGAKKTSSLVYVG